MERKTGLLRAALHLVAIGVGAAAEPGPARSEPRRASGATG